MMKPMAAITGDESGPGSFAWKSMRSSSLSVRIRGQILAFLADGGLSAGDRLPSERELAVRLGVSRPSVREAIKTLEAEGRLDVRHGQGVFVASSDAGESLRRSIQDVELDINELYAMREVLEVPAARWAAQRGDPEAISRVQAAHNRLLEASTQRPTDFDQLHLLDASFHQSIVQAAGNRFLEQTQGVLGEILVRGMSTTLTVEGRLEASRLDHDQILQAIVTGDGSAAAAAARRHVRAARKAALSMVAQRE
jgi:GntR family transcriptional repressor for pyruvate dehydrogenase complex